MNQTLFMSHFPDDGWNNAFIPMAPECTLKKNILAQKTLKLLTLKHVFSFKPNAKKNKTDGEIIGIGEAHRGI